jgi:hypothetical protein
MSKEIIRCIRCKRIEAANGPEAGGWNIVYEGGRPTGVICPNCQTPEESMEAEVNAATLDYGADERGHLTASPKGADACIVCGQTTDTGLGFTGEAEWIVAGLKILGVEHDRSALIVSGRTDNPPGKVPVGRFSLAFRVCSDCAEKAQANMEPGAPGPKPGPWASRKGMPHYVQRP